MWRVMLGVSEPWCCGRFFQEATTCLDRSQLGCVPPKMRTDVGHSSRYATGTIGGGETNKQQTRAIRLPTAAGYHCLP